MNQYFSVESITAARIEAKYPTTVRLVVYPDGREVMQGAYHWTQGFDGGITWRDMLPITVDSNGRDIPRG